MRSIERLFGLERHGIKLDLERMCLLDQYLQSPHLQFATVHVGGTNGKGSVTTKVAAALQLAGYRVGCYTSPHITHVTERIAIDGLAIKQDTFEADLMALFDIVDRHRLEVTFFELTTALAFYRFAKEKVDVAVIEVGMGGRLDATNIITPLLSIIVSISLDHTRYLGQTLNAIALQKAGIIKPQIPLLVGPDACLPVFQERARNMAAPYFEVATRGNNTEMTNRAVARRALELLPFGWHVEGLEKTPPCRFERIHYQGVSVVLDVAHNPAGFSALIDRLEATFVPVSFTVLLAMSEDKEIGPSLAILKTLSHKTHFFLTQSPIARAADPQQLQTYLEGCNTTVVHDLPEAFDRALAHAKDQRTALVVTGTFYIMSTVRRKLGIEEVGDNP